MSQLTRPLAADAATTQQVAVPAGEPITLSDRVDGRRSLLIHNVQTTPDGSSNTTWLWVGFDSNVSASRGFPVPPGATFQVSCRRPVYAFADAPLTAYTLAELDRIDVCDLPIGSR